MRTISARRRSRVNLRGSDGPATSLSRAPGRIVAGSRPGPSSPHQCGLTPCPPLRKCGEAGRRPRAAGERFEPIEALVGTGATYTWVPRDVLERLGVVPQEESALRAARG